MPNAGPSTQVAGIRTLFTSSPERDAATWFAVLGVGFVIVGLAVATHAHIGVGAAPFVGRYNWMLRPATLLAPAVGVAVLVAARARVHERLRWSVLLLAGWAAAFAWAIALALVDGRGGLAGPVRSGHEYLVDVPKVGHDAHRFLVHYVANAGSLSPADRQHPPGPVLLLWLLGRLGIHQPLTIGLLLTAVGAASVPLVAISVRSLCHEPAGRRLIPLLTLAPYALWLAVSIDAVTLTICAGAVTCAVIGSESGRRFWWAIAGGLLLGIGALFSYSVPWLAVTIIAVYFVRRRALLNVVTGIAALVPLTLISAAGFEWSQGLEAARDDFTHRIGPHRSWGLWIALDVVVLLIATGPAIIPAARKIRRTPGWPFVVGAGLAVLFALASGLARGEAERSWLPFLPWLLVPAVAPERRPDRPGVVVAAATPIGLISLGAAAAIVLEAALRSPW